MPLNIFDYKIKSSRIQPAGHGKMTPRQSRRTHPCGWDQNSHRSSFLLLSDGMADREVSTLPNPFSQPTKGCRFIPSFVGPSINLHVIVKVLIVEHLCTMKAVEPGADQQTPKSLIIFCPYAVLTPQLVLLLVK